MSKLGTIVTCTQVVSLWLHVQGFISSGVVLWASLCLTSDLWDLRNSLQVLLGGFENVIMTDGCKRSCATHTAGLVIVAIITYLCVLAVVL